MSMHKILNERGKRMDIRFYWEQARKYFLADGEGIKDVNKELIDFWPLEASLSGGS